MTCIVGYADNGEVIIGGDSAATSGYNSSIISSSKVFSCGEMVIGFAGSARGGSLLKNHLSNHIRPLYDESNEDISSYMEAEFPESVRNMFAMHGHNERDAGVDSSTTQALIGVRGRLFVLYGDYAVIEKAGKYNAIGSGQDFAMGSLFTTWDIEEISAQEKLEIALYSACEYTITCRPPFNFISTSENLLKMKAPKPVKRATTKKDTPARKKTTAKKETVENTTKKHFDVMVT